MGGKRCDHCYQLVAAGAQVVTAIPGSDKQYFCCHGCSAAAALIANMGLQDYYRFRDSGGATAPATMSAAELQVFSVPELLAPFLSRQGPMSELTLFVEGIHCAACVWLLEQALRQHASVRQVSVNLVNHEMRVRWLGDELGAAEIAERIHALGYRPRLPGTDVQPARQRQQRMWLARLLVSGLGAMQAMMYAVALYAGALDGIDPVYRDFFRIAGLIISTPVVFFGGWPFLSSALRALRAGSISMDVPVSLALLMGWAGSLVTTVTGGEHVYFESVSMFVFFLLVSRWLEARQRETINQQFDRLQADLPLLVERLDGTGNGDMVPARLLQPGDQLRIRQGDTLAVDARIIEGEALVQEAVLTGEPLPVSRSVNDQLVAGSQLLEGNVIVEALSRSSDSALARVGELVMRAQQQRALGVFDSPRVATAFVSVVLMLALLTMIAHMAVGTGMAFAATLAVLVVTCPCALAIAAPLTVAAGLGRALRHGVLVADVDALMALANIDTLLFDKTGTLTDGEFEVRACTLLDPQFTQAQALSVVSALEQHATHPLANALKHLAPPAMLRDIRLTATGVSGKDNLYRWHIGAASDGNSEFLQLQLSADQTPVLKLDLADRLKSASLATIKALQSQHIAVQLSSGDQSGPVSRIARALGIADFHAAQSPQMKTARLQTLQADGKKVGMVGDGINDAGALLQADVGIAVSGSSALARNAAHIYLLDVDISALPWLRQLSRVMRRVLRQNFGWALTYNLLAVPFAMLGWIPPWLAALGMSASSLIVTVNAARLSRWKS